MTDFIKLKAELNTDPLARGYAGMTDDAAADSLNTADRARDRSALSGDELFNAAAAQELAALATGSNAQKQAFEMFLSLCARDSIDPFGSANVRLVQEIFGAGSSTVPALAALRVETVSRAEELNIGEVTPPIVAHARSI